jgi:[ribosomal protein S18]-alanine N-acetyltransferase
MAPVERHAERGGSKWSQFIAEAGGRNEASRDQCNGPTRKEADMQTDQKQEVRVHIRWMIRRDMPEVLAMEQESFEFPWLAEDFVCYLRQRNCIGMVAEHDDRVVGFMIYELHKSRIHVLNFAVASDYRRCGVGSQMLAKLTAKLSTQRRSRIVLEVRETNLDAQLFFRENGFRAVSVLRSYYADTPEDAYLMQYRYRSERQPAAVPAGRITRMAG